MAFRLTYPHRIRSYGLSRRHGRGVIDIEHNAVGTEPISGYPCCTAWLKDDRRVWLVVPLTHMSGLLGFVVLGRPRAPRDLNWEDFDLLKTAGRQAASYIAEEQASQSLAKARRFEDFNRQFAFVVHDIKNLAGQMSLILKNAERHGDNPQFQIDVLATVADSLKRMHALLDQLKQRRTASVPVNRVDLAATLRANSRNVGKFRFLILTSTCQPTRSISSQNPSRSRRCSSHLVQKRGRSRRAGWTRCGQDARRGNCKFD